MSYFQHQCNIADVEILSALGLADLHIVEQDGKQMLYATTVNTGVVLA